MSISKDRFQAVCRAVKHIRQIEKDVGINYESLKNIRSELIELTNDKILFPQAYSHITDTGDSAVNRLTEDHDHRFALCGSVGVAGKMVSPHNHTTWAVIVSVYGEELNRFFERTDDHSRLS